MWFAPDFHAVAIKRDHSTKVPHNSVKTGTALAIARSNYSILWN